MHSRWITPMLLLSRHVRLLFDVEWEVDEVHFIKALNCHVSRVVCQ